MATGTPRVFVSHSHVDNEFGLRLIADLRRDLGSEDAVWYDVSGGLHGGDAWWRRIVAEITAREVFLVVLSPDAVASKWVEDEIDLAWQQKNKSKTGKLIVPVLYRMCNVRADLETRHMVSFIAPKVYGAAYGDLLSALGVTRPSTTASPPRVPVSPDPPQSPASPPLVAVHSDAPKPGPTLPTNMPSLPSQRFGPARAISLLIPEIGFFIYLLLDIAYWSGYRPNWLNLAHLAFDMIFAIALFWIGAVEARRGGNFGFTALAIVLGLAFVPVGLLRLDASETVYQIAQLVLVLAMVGIVAEKNEAQAGGGRA
jgi:hypothetical protein